MSRIVAAVDNSPAAGPVLETAQWLGRILRSDVVGVFVDGGDTPAVEAIADASGTGLATRHGDPTQVITDYLAADDVVLGVIGTRAWPGGRRPAGHTALDVAQASTKPLVVVPPERPPFDRGARCRVLAALDDTPESVAGVRALLRIFDQPGVDVLAVHVFESANVPPFWDQAQHAAESWGRELMARHLCDIDTRVELRSGAPGLRVVEVAEAESVDLVAMTWSQDLSEGRAQTVKQVLSGSPVPVLLMPVRAKVRAP